MRLASDQLRKLVDASSIALYRMSADWAEVLDLGGDAFLTAPGESRDWLARYIPVADQAALRARIAEAILGRAPFAMEHRVFRADGSVGWIQSRALPSLNANGEVVDWVGSAIDVTSRRNSEDALRENEARQVFLLKLSDAVRPLADPRAIKEKTTRLLGEYLDCDRVSYVEVAPDGDTLTIEADYCRPGIFSLVGSLRFRDFGLGVVEILLSGRPLAVADTACFGGLSASERAAYQGIGVAAYVAAPIIKDGRTRALLSVHQSVARSWTPPEVLLAQDVADRTWEAVERARAETALRDSEGQLRALVAELQHRTHNLLGVVSSIASRTFRAHSDPAECKVAFKESLKALSNAQRLLSHLQEGQRVTLDELLRAEFTSLAVANEGRRITLVGPPGIRLRSSGLQTLALALHELAVNSSRYGALQARTGKLEVRWRLARNGDGKSWLEIDWRESGVSIVGSRGAATVRGHGRELIEKALPYQLGARTSLEFTEDGVHCAIALPVSETSPRQQ